MPEYVLFPDSSGQPVTRAEGEQAMLRYLDRNGAVKWLPESWTPPSTPPPPPGPPPLDVRRAVPSAQWYGWPLVVLRQTICIVGASFALLQVFAAASLCAAWLNGSYDIGPHSPVWFPQLHRLAGVALWLWYELRRQGQIRRLIAEQEPGYVPPAPDPRELGALTIPAIWALAAVVTVIALEASVLGGISESTSRAALGPTQVVAGGIGLLYNVYRGKIGERHAVAG